MRISAKHIVQISACLLLLVLVLLSLNKFHNTTCNNLEVTIDSSPDTYFIDENGVIEMIHWDTISGYKMDSVDIYAIHNTLKDNPYIRNVSIYKTISGVLKIDIQQRKPIIMVLGNNQSYYVDTDGYIFSTSPNYNARLVVVNGFINDVYDFNKSKLYSVDHGVDKNLQSTTTSLYQLAKLIVADDFWRDQIEQIYVNKFGEFELVPMIGSQILDIGTIDEYDKKMYVLKQFYQKAMNRVGWNTYSQISVKYKGQIVCKRRDDKK